MSDPVKIPFGYKAVIGQLQKGDGVYNYETHKFVPARKEEIYVSVKRKVWPKMMMGQGLAIRKCEVVQTELPVETEEME